MKKLIQSLVFSMIILAGFQSFAQVTNGGPTTTKTKCSANCMFGTCEIYCESSASSGGGGAVCTCVYGFPVCGCGGGGHGSASANVIQMENLNKAMNHLLGYSSNQASGLRTTMGEYLNEILAGDFVSAGRTVGEIIVICDGLDPAEKSRFTLFVSSLSN